jgi:DNA-binding NtrC family response regulator
MRSGSPPAHLLVVDDDRAIRFGLREYLKASGFLVSEADSCASAEAKFVAGGIDVVLCDYQLPDGNAIHLLKAFKALDKHVPVIILTAHGSIDLAVRAIQSGAEQFLTKPLDMPSVVVVVDKALENWRNRRHLAGEQLEQARHSIAPFLGKSAGMRALEKQASRIVNSDAPVLILGETGAGKGVLARWLHQNGPRAREPYVDLNCAALARELIESELFGHEKGSFTGAATAKAGLVEVAHRGTMFLDEIGDMDLAVQPKLLKVLEEKRFRRIGGTRERTVDLRFIAAANQDLAKKAEEKAFRQDLLYRINTITLQVPPLRTRREDIPLLAATILGTLARDMPHGERTLTTEAVQALQDYHWPGNVRQLRNVLEHAVLLTEGQSIDVESLGLPAQRRQAEPTEPPPGDFTMKAVEIQEIVRALQAEGGRVERAARRLGIPRSSLYQKIKKYGIPVPKAS